MNTQPYIVIIDDDNDDSGLLNECFQKIHPIPVYCFDRGSSFFQFMDHQVHGIPCLVVIDLNLPQLSGAAVASKLKEHPLLSSTSIIVFTTGGTPAEKEICEKANVAVLKKPNSIKEWEAIAFLMFSHFASQMSTDLNAA